MIVSSQPGFLHSQRVWLVLNTVQNFKFVCELSDFSPLHNIYACSCQIADWKLSTRFQGLFLGRHENRNGSTPKALSCFTWRVNSLKYIESPVWILSREDQLRGRGFEVDGTGLMGVQDAPDRSWTLHVELLDQTGCESRREPTSGVISRDFLIFHQLCCMLRLFESISTKAATMLLLYDERTRCSSSRWSLLRIHLVVRPEAHQHLCHWNSLKAPRLQVLLDIAGGTNANLWCEPGGQGGDLWFRCGWTHTTRKHQSVSSILRL